MYIIRYLQSGFPLHFSPSSLVALLLDSEGPVTPNRARSQTEPAKISCPPCPSSYDRCSLILSRSSS
ncbi:hypothetical protein BGY98DRAFT_333756 [Russula aff. rugulosa BPL654]|nr:hypothetical protein BGY98DRAFT_333756 [Russula aff. rugulosa BPL654]